MKKLLLLCAMLLSIIGAYGIDYPKVGVTYTIKNVYGFYHDDSNAANYKHYMIAHSDGAKLIGTGSLTFDNLEDCQWVFEKVVDAENADNAFYLKNYKTNKYVYVENPSNGQIVTLNATKRSKIYLFDGTSSKVDGEYFISFTNINKDDAGGSLGIHGNSGMTIWQGNGRGNQWFLEEVSPVYTIEGGTSGQHRGFLAAGVDIPAYPVLSGITWTTHSGNSTPAIEGGKYWYIQSIGNENTYVLYNLGIGKYLVNESDKVNFGDYPYAWKIVDNTPYKAITIYDGNTQISFACGTKASTSARNVNLYDQMSDGGSKHTLTLVLPSELRDFADQITEVKSKVSALANAQVPLTFSLTDSAQHTHSYTGGGELYPLISGVEGYVMRDSVWNGNTFNADITFPVPVSSETVSNPTFISTYNYNKQDPDQFKWYASDNKIKVKEGEEIFSSSIASHLWLIYPKFNNGAFTFQIKNVATGLFINSSVSSDKHDDESTVILSNEATDFTVGKRGSEGAEFINSFEKRLSVNTSDPNPADKIQTVGTYGTHYGTALTFPVPGFNVTIGATGYATLYSPITVLPEAGNQTLEIYQIVSAPKNNSVTLYQMPYVYKNQGVILKGNSETKYWFALTDWDYITEEDWKYNKLKGSYVDTYVAGPAYVLSAPDGVKSVGLYKAEMNMNGAGVKVGVETGTHFKNNAGKAYLPASEVPSNARFLVFSFGDDMETGITETENGNVKTEVYDLSGRRVQGAQKGIFIVNGKKVVR